MYGGRGYAENYQSRLSLHLSHDGMYFFCTAECKENWLYSAEEGTDSEFIVSP
jgi:YHS domain-containing protein